MKWGIPIAVLSAILIVSSASSLHIRSKITKDILTSPVAFKIEAVGPGFNEQVKNEIVLLTSGTFKRAGKRLNVSDIMEEVEEFRKAAGILALTPDTLTGENKKLGSRLKSLIIKFQSTDLPVLRKNYINALKDSLLNGNIKVEGSDLHICFQSVDFANKELLEKFNNKTMKELQMLRFKQVRYKWIYNDDNPVCYEINNVEDKDISYSAYK